MTAGMQLLPTLDDALDLFDAVAELLGEDCWIHEQGHPHVRALHARDGRWVLPWPVLTFGTMIANAPGAVRGPDGPIEGKPPDGQELEELRVTLEVVVREASTRLSYHLESGELRETASGSDGAATVPMNGIDADGLARRIARQDLAAFGPGRLLVPVHLPGSPAGAWSTGLKGIRDALWAGVPPNTRHVIADGVSGSAVACGADTGEALARWHEAVLRTCPEPAGPIGWSPEGGLPPRVPTRTERREWPVGIPEMVTAVMVPVEPERDDSTIPEQFAEIGFRRWTRLIDQRGRTVHVLVRADETGFATIGEDLVEGMDAVAFDELLARADERVGREAPIDDSRLTVRVSEYEYDGCELRVSCGPGWLAEYRPRELDGGRVRAKVVQVKLLAR